MSAEPDEVTALICRTIVLVNHQGEVLTDGQIADLAVEYQDEAEAVRDALANAGLIRTDAYPITTQNVLTAEPLRRMLVNTVEQMTVAQRERWELAGYYRARTEMMGESTSG